MLTMLKLEHMCKDIVTISYLPQHYIQICKMFNNYIATLEQCPQKKQKQNLYSSWSFRLYTLQPHKWCVWIPLICWKLKTYCWKHCSKIIFKYVNSAMGPKNVLVCAFLRFFIGREQYCGTQRKMQTLYCLKMCNPNAHKITPSYFKLLYYLWLWNKIKIYK